MTHILTSRLFLAEWRAFSAVWPVPPLQLAVPGAGSPNSAGDPAPQVTDVTASGGPLSPADHVTSAGSPRLTRPAVIARPSAPQWVAPRRVRPGRGSYATGGRPLTQLSGRYVA